MGERAKVILNEYSAKNLLMRDTLDLDKFYTADLKLFVEVARKEIERLNNIIKEAREYLTDEGICILNKGKQENERLVWTWENYYDLLEILKGSDIE